MYRYTRLQYSWMRNSTFHSLLLYPVNYFYMCTNQIFLPSRSSNPNSADFAVSPCHDVERRLVQVSSCPPQRMAACVARAACVRVAFSASDDVSAVLVASRHQLMEQVCLFVLFECLEAERVKLLRHNHQNKCASHQSHHCHCSLASPSVTLRRARFIYNSSESGRR